MVIGFAFYERYIGVKTLHLQGKPLQNQVQYRWVAIKPTKNAKFITFSIDYSKNRYNETLSTEERCITF